VLEVHADGNEAKAEWLSSALPPAPLFILHDGDWHDSQQAHCWLATSAKNAVADKGDQPPKAEARTDDKQQPRS